ncbi:MAG: MotA/TolQ/ExbB proton channel family protein [Hyphomicrobiales bacterium]|nr:MotA/TolQ/ExbB proton channel family protein [Hyphomicrobiales bacterium]
MAADEVRTELSSPRIFLIRMGVFLALAGFVAFILHEQIQRAFMANPGLNGLILGVLAVGVVLAVATVTRLFREIAWVNAWGGPDAANVTPPRLLAPMARLAGDGRGISTITLRAILDSVATRLDESREILRYLTGLLIFLGLLGTFWGLLETVGSIGDVINAMKGGAESSVLFEDLKAGIAKPLAGMSLSFTASLFGLAGSLVLGFLDLQAGQAQNRFYVELEDRVSAAASADAPAAAAAALSPDLRATLERMSTAADSTGQRAASAAMANLADGVQALVKHMRSEQQMIRDWVEQQAGQNRDIKKALERLAQEQEKS